MYLNGRLGNIKVVSKTLAGPFNRPYAINAKVALNRNSSNVIVRKMSLWPLSRGFLAHSALDPYLFMWPERALSYDDFTIMRRQMEDDLRRRDEIFNRMHENFFKDFMLFMNNPERATIDPKTIAHSVGTSIEHHQNGKNHTFKRSITVNGKTDTITADFDGEKTTVKYDGDKQVVLPGFYDITVNVVKDSTPESAPVDEKLKEMTKQLEQGTESSTKAVKNA
jgi:hypothetical protein